MNEFSDYDFDGRVGKLVEGGIEGGIEGTDDIGIDVLDADQCLLFLRGASVGCLALPTVGAPELRPVNFVVDGGSIVIRTGEGQILEAARRGLAASFLIYGIDPLEHTGWSVSVTGKLSQRETNALSLSLHLRPWASGRKDRFVKLFLSQITGRRIPPGRGNR